MTRGFMLILSLLAAVGARWLPAAEACSLSSSRNDNANTLSRAFGYSYQGESVMFLTCLRYIAGTSLTLLSLLSSAIIAVGILASDHHPATASASMETKIGAYLVYAVVAGASAWASYALFHNPTTRPSSVPTIEPMNEGEPCFLHEGEVFPRPWYFGPLTAFGFLLNLILMLAGTLIFAAGLSMLVARHDGGGGATAFGLFLALPGGLFSYTLWQALKLRGLPLAIVTTESLILPGRRPCRLSWSEVASIRAFNMGKTALMEVMPQDPSSIMPKRRGWWHGPWRDGIYVNVGNKVSADGTRPCCRRRNRKARGL